MDVVFAKCCAFVRKAVLFTNIVLYRASNCIYLSVIDVLRTFRKKNESKLYKLRFIYLRSILKKFKTFMAYTMSANETYCKQDFFTVLESLLDKPDVISWFSMSIKSYATVESFT